MLKRQTSGSIKCPKCGRLISANSKKCSFCGRWNPGLWGYGPSVRRLFGDFDMVKLILGTSIFLYIASLLADLAAIFQTRGFLGLLSPSMQSLDALGMTGRYAMAQGRWWTLITAIYLHGSILHILFNMLWLRQLGHLVEQWFGSGRSFLIFTFSGILGFYISDMVNIPFTVGASGSIFGLLGALVYFGRKSGGEFGNAVYRQVGTWAIILFVMGFLMPGVNNLAHAGGFAGGYLAALVLKFNDIKPENQSHQIAALATALLTIVCFVLEIIT
ncbi:MAG: rhomboid family intramembrane serine protease [candidate division KSB1 bacterium]|nr:rhomboid family intramembrane serine protease [candidate division KSB1 bacterium]